MGSCMYIQTSAAHSLAPLIRSMDEEDRTKDRQWH